MIEYIGFVLLRGNASQKILSYQIMQMAMHSVIQFIEKKTTNDDDDDEEEDYSTRFFLLFVSTLVVVVVPLFIFVS